jgi:hypothetical protein
MMKTSTAKRDPSPLEEPTKDSVEHLSESVEEGIGTGWMSSSKDTAERNADNSLVG